MEKNICVVAVGEQYRRPLLMELDRLKMFGWNVHVLTDDPSYFPIPCKEYRSEVFSYVDKIVFSIRTSIDIKSGILSVDSDRICNLSDEFLEKGVWSDSFLYIERWPDWDYLGSEDLEDWRGYFDILKQYFEKNNFNYKKLPCILEQLFYIPYIPELREVLRDVEIIKPILEYMSIFHEYPYPGIGNGEGLALSYGIKNNKCILEQFSIYPYKGNKRFI